MKVHRVISFNQEPFSKDFLEMMTLRRKNAKSKFMERLYKDMANQLYVRAIRNFLYINIFTIIFYRENPLKESKIEEV